MEQFVTQFGIGPFVQILLVEDDPLDRALFCLAARKTFLNLAIQSVAHGWHAVEYLEGRPRGKNRGVDPLPQVVVVDLRMPVMDGLDFLRWCKSSPRFGRLPVVMLSGELREVWGRQARELGADRCVEKPFHLRELVQVVHELWEVARASAACGGVTAHWPGGERASKVPLLGAGRMPAA